MKSLETSPTAADKPRAGTAQQPPAARAGHRPTQLQQRAVPVLLGGTVFTSYSANHGEYSKE